MNPTDHDGAEDHGGGEDRRWLDDPRNVTRIVYGLAGLCALALLADFFYLKHPFFDIEEIHGFYAVYGFVVSAALVLTAKQMRKVVGRPEDYYERGFDDHHEQPVEDDGERRPDAD
jgi:hypothetical protein